MGGAGAENGKSFDNSRKVADTTAEIPLLCRFWNHVSDRSSHFRWVTIGGLDYTMTVLSAVFLTCCRFWAEYIQITAFGWPGPEDAEKNMITKIASTSAAAVVHSSILVPSVGTLLWSQPYRPMAGMETAPRWYQQSVDAVMQFCIGYMLYDAILNILILKWGDNGLDSGDVMFLVHHMFTTYYMTSTRITRAGHISAMMCMFWGELTNPLHNSYYIAEAAMTLDCCNGPLAQQLFAAIEIAFCVLYVLVRCLIPPIFLLHMTYCLLARRHARTPVWLVGTWVVAIWAVTLGSIPWITECWSKLVKYYNQYQGEGSISSINNEL